jgi:hypothetical protein
VITIPERALSIKTNQKQISEKYNAKYSYLIERNVSEKCNMRIKRLIWRFIKSLNKQLEKKGLQIERITGKNMRDWKNLTNCRYISIFDFFQHRNRSYYLEQCMPKEILLSDKNPFKNFIK